MSVGAYPGLPDVSAVLTLADGSTVMPDGKIVRPKKESTVEVPSHGQAQRLIAQTRRRVADLPALPKTMNTVSVVLSYTLFGLDEIEIAQATGLSTDQVGRIKMLEAYSRMQDEVIRSVIASDTGSVRDMIAQHSRKAVAKIIDIIDEGPDDLALSASKDILDRAGHRPVDIVEHHHRLDGGLVIEIRKKDDTASAPVIDITPGDAP
jgi:hypothetical protein